MLDYMRKHASSIIIKIILGVVILAFVLYFGFTGGGRGGGEVVAKVDGLSIRGREYTRAYREMVERYRALLGNQLTDEMLEKMDIKKAVLDDLIERALLVVEARNLGLKVSSQELRDAIVTFPLFHENGQFNPALYRMYLSSVGQTAGEFEEQLREQILIRKLTGLLLSSIKISDDELDEYYRIKEEKLVYEYLEIDPESFKSNGDIKDKEIGSYFEKHRDEFRLPPSVKLRFIKYRIEDVERDIDVSNEEIEEFYNDNIKMFREPRRIKLREIFFPLRADDPKSMDKAEESARQAYEELSKGADFKDVARKYSVKKRGSLGEEVLISEKELDQTLANVAFSMKEGQFSKPVITKNGVHIIKVEKIYEGRPKPINEVRKQIIQLLKKQKAEKYLAEIADKAVWDAAKSGGLDKYGSSKGLRVFETGMINELNTEALPQALIRRALASKEREIFRVVEGGIAIVSEVVKKQEARVPELSEVMGKVRERMIKEMARSKAKEIAEGILTQALRSGSLKEYAKGAGIRFGETKPLKRYEINKTPFYSEGGSELILLSEKNPIVPKVMQRDGKLYIVKLSKRILPDTAGMKKDELGEELMKLKAEEYLKMYVRSLRDKYRIKIYMK